MNAREREGERKKERKRKEFLFEAKSGTRGNFQIARYGAVRRPPAASRAYNPLSSA